MRQAGSQPNFAVSSKDSDAAGERTWGSVAVAKNVSSSSFRRQGAPAWPGLGQATPGRDGLPGRRPDAWANRAERARVDVLPHAPAAGPCAGRLAGCLSQDHWKAYFTVPEVRHQLGNAHHWRDLQALVDPDLEAWTGWMQRSLRQVNRAVQLVREWAVRFRGRSQSHSSRAALGWSSKRSPITKPGRLCKPRGPGGEAARGLARRAASYCGCETARPR